MTIKLNAETMEIEESYTEVASNPYGYVSHSFNQFVKYDDDGSAVTADHKDGYPRAIVLNKNVLDDSEESYAKSVMMMDFPGEIGDNYTGASVGGFEISKTHYIVVGNTINQNDFDNSRTRMFSYLLSGKTLKILSK